MFFSVYLKLGGKIIFFKYDFMKFLNDIFNVKKLYIVIKKNMFDFLIIYFVIGKKNL